MTESLHHNYRLAELEAMPTLCVGQADDLKVDRDGIRVWLCRCGVEDGMRADNIVSVEAYREDQWVTVRTYVAE